MKQNLKYGLSRNYRINQTLDKDLKSAAERMGISQSALVRYLLKNGTASILGRQSSQTSLDNVLPK